MRHASFAFGSLLLFVASFGATVPAFAQSADLAIGKTGPSTATVGSNVVYTVTVQNNGPDDAANAQMNDVIPSGMTFVSNSQTTGPTFTCADPAVGSNGTVTCTLATFPVGASATFQITVNIPGMTAPGTLFVNTATVSSDTVDNNAENNTSSAGTSVPGTQADVGITKTGPANAAEGANVTYTITLVNNGPSDATTVTWNDTFGAGLTFVSLNQTSGPTFNCPGATTPCTLATFPAGSSATFDLVATVSNTPGTYTDTASVTSDNDPNPENDSSSVGTNVSNADVGVTKSAPATAMSGGTLSYTITLSNSGPDAAVNARFSDTLPAGVTFASLAQNTGPTASCIFPSAGSGGTVTCNIGSLLNGQSAQFTLGVNVDSGVANGTLISNTATAATDSADTNPNNNTSSAATTINAQADVAVTKTAPATSAAGSNLTYTLSVTNAGPAAAANVSLADTLPAGETFVSITQTAGPTFNCTGGATVTCSIASLAANATATFSLTAAVGAGVADGTILSNTATVTSTTTDPTPGNNSSTASTTVQATADLTLTKTGPATVRPGGTLTYVLTLGNAGPSSASSVSLTDTLPAGETFASLTQTAGPLFTCTTPAVGSGGTITCNLASFAAGSSATFNLVVGIPGSTTSGSVLVNSASATSTTADPTGANNAASASVTVQAAPAFVAATPTLDARMLWLLVALLGAVAVWRERQRGPR